MNIIIIWSSVAQVMLVMLMSDVNEWCVVIQGKYNAHFFFFLRQGNNHVFEKHMVVSLFTFTHSLPFIIFIRYNIQF